MAITMTRSYSVDLQKGAEHAVLRAPLATMDNQAHIFEVQVDNGGEAADLSGAVCEAYFIRADGVTVMLDGAVSGSTATVTLGANCYAVPGRFELAVKLTQGDTVHTILRVEGSVTASRTDAMTGAGTGAQRPGATHHRTGPDGICSGSGPAVELYPAAEGPPDLHHRRQCPLPQHHGKSRHGGGGQRRCAGRHDRVPAGTGPCTAGGGSLQCLAPWGCRGPVCS